MNTTKRITDYEKPFLEEYLSQLDLVESGIQGSNPAVNDNAVSRAEFQNGFIQLVDLLRRLIQNLQIPAPTVTVTPNVIAQIQPHVKRQSISRDTTGKIESVTSEIE